MKYKNKKFIDENIPVKELYKAGFLKSKTDYNDIEERVCTFFGLQNIYQYRHILDKKDNFIKAKNIFSEN